MSVSQSIFSNLLLLNLQTDVDPLKVLETGASELRNVFSGEHLQDVLDGYMVGLRGTFALGVALGVAAVATSFVPPILSIKKTSVEILAGAGA